MVSIQHIYVWRVISSPSSLFYIIELGRGILFENFFENSWPSSVENNFSYLRPKWPHHFCRVSHVYALADTCQDLMNRRSSSSLTPQESLQTRSSSENDHCDAVSIFDWLWAPMQSAFKVGKGRRQSMSNMIAFECHKYVFHWEQWLDLKTIFRVVRGFKKWGGRWPSRRKKIQKLMIFLTYAYLLTFVVTSKRL